MQFQLLKGTLIAHNILLPVETFYIFFSTLFSSLGTNIQILGNVRVMVIGKSMWSFVYVQHSGLQMYTTN